jgi:putative MATE family efflux protein
MKRLVTWLCVLFFASCFDRPTVEAYPLQPLYRLRFQTFHGCDTRKRINAYRSPSRLKCSDSDKNVGESVGAVDRSANAETLKRIGDLAIPALGALALDPLLSLVDTIIVGQNDSLGLAAIGLNTFVFTFVFYIFNFLSTVSAPLIAEKRGAGKTAEANVLVNAALTIAGVLGFILFLALELNGETILIAMGSASGTLPAALSFLRLRAIAAPAVLICSAGNGAFRGRLDTTTPFKIALCANLGNLILDFILVLQLGYGANGAACATGIAEWGSAIAFVVLLKREMRDLSSATSGISIDKDGTFCQNPVSLEKEGDILPDIRRQLRDFFAASGATFLRTVLLQCALTAAAAAAARADAYGADPTALNIEAGESYSYLPGASSAAHQVASSIWLLLSFIVDAIAVAAQTLVADARGTGNFRRASNVSSISLGLGITVGCGFLLALALLPENVLVATFTRDPSVADAVMPLVPILAVSQPINGFVFVADGVLQGYRAFRYEAVAMLAAIIFTGAFVTVQNDAASFSSSNFQLEDVWLSLLILQLSRATAFAFWWFAPMGRAAANFEVE